jgi:hypothetical protein
MGKKNAAAKAAAQETKDAVQTPTSGAKPTGPKPAGPKPKAAEVNDDDDEQEDNGNAGDSGDEDEPDLNFEPHGPKISDEEDDYDDGAQVRCWWECSMH